MTAIKTTGLGDNWYVGGFNLSSDTQSIGRVGGGPAALNGMTGIDKLAYERLGGLRDGGMDWVSFFDKQANQAHLALGALPRADTVVSYFHQPGTIGSAAASMIGLQIGYDPTRAADGMLTFAVSAQSDAYGLEWGQALTPGVKTDTAATNGTGLDFGATSSLFGGQAYLHVFSVTGTSVTVKLQDSADNVTFADLTGGGFATVLAGAKGGQRIALSNAATVRRYVRAVTTGTFSNAQFAVNFVRNEIAGQVF